MKNLFKIMGVFALIAFVGFASFGIPEALDGVLGLSTAMSGSIVSLVPWLVTIEGVESFKALSPEELKALSDDEYSAYMTDKFENSEGKMTKLVAEQAKASEDRMLQIQKEVYAVKDEQYATVKEQLTQMALVVERQKEDSTTDKKNALKKYIKENSEVLAKIKANKNHEDGALSIELKGSQGAGDITSGSDYAEFVPGTLRIPVRKTSIMEIFKRKPVSTEYIKYREEDVVTRDAKFVIACASSTHTTKKTWINRTVELAKIRDIVDICMDMLDDYAFVESEIRELIEESVKLKADFELLLGTGVAATDMLSIETVSSEFNPANVLADFSAATGTPFQDANLEQLADAMSAQISIFGEQNSWMADTIIMNFKDFVNYRNLKDANGNKLIHTLSDTVATIAGLTVVTSPIVVANTCYVFDSTRGSILDRQLLTVKTSFENKDNIEHETVTLVAVERLQFHVPLSQRDAFMKCSDLAVAIAAILKV